MQYNSEFFSAGMEEARRFNRDLNPTGDRQLAVGGGLEHCTQNYAFLHDTFPFFYSFECAARGHGEVRLKDRTYEGNLQFSQDASGLKIQLPPENFVMMPGRLRYS